MINLDEIEQRLTKIEARAKELEAEAPLLTKALSDAEASGNAAEIMICQIAMASKLTEAKDLFNEVVEIRESLPF